MMERLLYKILLPRLGKALTRTEFNVFGHPELKPGFIAVIGGKCYNLWNKIRGKRSMGSDVNEVLQQAMEFYVAGHTVEAKALLLDLVRAHPTLEAGWMFLSYTLDDPIQKTDCLRQVLKINPKNSEAKGALGELVPEQESGSVPASPALAHASPFTVDISHATDEIAEIKSPLPAEGSGAKAIRAFPEGPELPKPAPPAAGEPRETARVTPPRGEVPTAPIQSARSPAKPVTPPPAVAESPQPAKPKKNGLTCLVIVVVTIVILGGIGAGLWATGFFNVYLTSGIATPTLGSTDTPVVFTLPPRWTDTPPPTETYTPTISPTSTPTPTPTMVPPDATQQADVAKLEKQVEDLRGLQWDGSPPVYVVSKGQAEDILQLELDRSGYAATIGNQEKVLVALGMIKPTYDLSKYALTRLSDGVLGFYMPSNKTMYVIGSGFGGMEHFVFSHEFDHALVNHFFPAVGIMDNDPICVNDSQRCEAIRALVEGDAMLLMNQWYNQYATYYDKQAISQYQAPFSSPPEDNTPPYFSPDVDFSYTTGMNFVYALWQKGNWAEVNKAYDNLPVSTEQILHPEKYLRGEKPVVLTVPDLLPALGNRWTLVGSDSLGEFMSYLLLAYGADNLADIPQKDALTATAGWGGDHYLVYSSTDGNQTVLAAEWTWDTDKDAAEFYSSLNVYLDKRFRGETTNPPAAGCWSMNNETTCVFHTGRNTLWILAPDITTVNTVRSSYPAYS
jgi:hypothetical protein